MARSVPSQCAKILKAILIVLLCLFSAASVIFSFYVLFTDLNPRTEVSPAQGRGLFTVFIYDNIDEVHPQRLPAGHIWTIKNIDFPNKNSAIVEAVDGTTRTKLEFIYAIEYPKVRVYRINDVMGRELQDAQLALIRFLGFLHDGGYTNAAWLYGGPLAPLTAYGSATAGVPKLLEGYCTKVSPENKCLPFLIQRSERDAVSGNYIFMVTYQLSDNSILTLGDGTKEFTQIVRLNDANEFVVDTLPFDH